MLFFNICFFRKNRRGDSDDEEDDDNGSGGEVGGDEELVFEKETIKKDKNDELRELANFERASRLSAKQKV